MKTLRRMGIAVLVASAANLAPVAAAGAEQDPSPAGFQAADTLRLAALHVLAVEEDARTRRSELERRAAALRMENVTVGRLPQFQLRGDAAYQSEVISLPFEGPDLAASQPPKERYELALEADWRIWDGGIAAARRDVERAGLSSTLATIDAEVFQTRAEVSDAFFSALLLQEQEREVDLLIEDLESRLLEVRVRVEEGAALPGDMASMRAELLGALQRRDRLVHDGRTALRVLARLVGRPIPETAILALPQLSEQMAAHATAGAADPRSRLPAEARLHPQFSAFDAQRETRERQAAAVEATRRPSVSLFGQLAYGSPGFDQFNDSLHEYWRAGVRVQWAPWSWNRHEREIEELALQRRIVDTHEERFRDALLRALEHPLGTIENMRAALDSDDEIVALREEAEAYARAQLEERAIPVSVYTRARTDLQDARIARLLHGIELARAQARYLITLGVELR